MIASSKKTRLTAAFTAVVMAVTAVFALTGCSFFTNKNDYVDFSKSTLELAVGDEYDLAGLIRSNTSNYTLTSSNASVVSLKGTTASALKSGKATVTAKTSKGSQATLNVVVADEDAFSVEVNGALVQTVGKSSVIEFIPTAKGSVASEKVVWKINGDVASELSARASFKFEPSEAGEYEVVAEAANGFSAEFTVRAYITTEASGTISGELEQDEPFAPLALSATVRHVAQNPDDHIEWRVDGVTVYAGTETQTSYMPSVGYHTFELYVNGEKREIDGAPSVRATFRGSVVPEAPQVLFDNMYPNIYVTSNVVGDMQVEITSPDGTVDEFSETDPALSYTFNNDYGFNTRNVIYLCANGTADKYKIRVRSLGDGGAYLPSDYSEYTEFVQLPSEAQPYIADRELDFDAYITSPQEYAELLEYNIIYRTKVGNTKVSFRCYIAYEFEGGANSYAEALFEDSFHWAATSGSYTNISTTIRNKVMTTSFYVDTINSPSRETWSSVNEYLGAYAKQLHAIMPHINYDADLYRPDNYVFPIDRLSNTSSVRYSDELYLAAEHNTRPIPVAGSAADTIYKMAKSVLRQIVTDDMTDAQKAHAIYDWIMWQVTYDTEAAEITKDGEAYSAYYLEGVFGDGKTPIGGKVYHPYAVCDGMSKAYSLMCNIEGIPCVRVSGMAGESKDDAGGHAWNKVCLDGEWYLVDCTWGDGTAVMEFDRDVDVYELALHDWLFVTDQYADLTHYEPYEFGESSMICAPETSTKGYNVYKEMTYNGVEIDCSIGGGDDELERFAEICEAFAEAYTPRTSVYIPGYKDGNYRIDREGIEIYFEDGVTSNELALVELAEDTIKAVRPRAEVSLYTYGNVLLLLIEE